MRIWLRPVVCVVALIEADSAAAEPSHAPVLCSQESESERVHCELERRFAADPRAARLARELYDRAGWVSGVEEEHIMNGGWRGKIRIVPELPVGKYRYRLEGVAAAAKDFLFFFERLEDLSPTGLRYRYRHVTFRFFRSVKRRTPSAYTSGWSIAYNVKGSLFGSAAGVRHTLFHEVFHLNDQARGWWSNKALSSIYDKIVARCRKGQKLDDACLSPYAPGMTKVKGNTYYAFHPGEGVEEYAAELALRYFLETRRVLAGKRPPKNPFKCSTRENLQAWRLLVDEFFAGVDPLADCP